MRRFFFHYRKSDGKMTIHFKNQCIIVNEVNCLVPCETKRNKRQPRLVMRGFCKRILVNNKIGTIL